jgi:hypothetical protein
MVVAIETKDPLVKRPMSKVAVNKDSIEGITRATDKDVYGTFINIECPGQSAKICCRLYKNMNYFSQVLEDGQRYTIPLSVARFINERISYQPHHYKKDEKGNDVKDSKPQARYKFMIEAA